MSKSLHKGDGLPAEEAHGAASLAEYIDIHYLDPAACEFEATAGGFVRLTLRPAGTQYPRVDFHRAFPLTQKDRYISVRDMEGDEIGVIEDIHAFAPDVVSMIQAELERRYFTPAISRIKELKEEFGYAYWHVDTDMGQRRFTVRDMHSNVIPLTPERLLIVDVDGNRYDVHDWTRLDPRSRRYIDDLL